MSDRAPQELTALARARDRKPDDLLTARQISDQYGMSLRTAEGLMRNLGGKDKVVRIPGFRRVFARRRDVEPQSSGGTTCE